MIQARLFAQIVWLEMQAQATSHRPRKETFAAGWDIHERQVPQGAHNNEYRPGAVPPGMPTLLVGSQAERVKQAQSLALRAQGVIETTRNLVALESEDAFLRWEEATRQVSEARAAVTAGDKLAETLSKDFISGLRVRVEDVVNARVVAAQAQAQLNEFRYRQIVALADLERATAGGFCAGLAGAPSPQPRPSKEGEAGGDRARSQAAARQRRQSGWAAERQDPSPSPR
jgi:hypothetical protein